MLRTGSVLLNSLALKYLGFFCEQPFREAGSSNIGAHSQTWGTGDGGVDVMISQRQGLLMADQFEAEGDLFRAADTRSIYR